MQSNVLRHLFLSMLLLAPAVLAHSATISSTDCRTPIGQPCHTIRYRRSQWQLFHRGFTDISRYAGEWTSAVRRDGSFASTSEVHNYVSLTRKASNRRPFLSLYLAPEDQVIRINHEEKTISRRAPLIWHDRPYRRSADGDITCSTGILHSGTDFTFAGESIVAGVPVVKWVRGNHWNREEIHLAPSLDCAALKAYSIRRNRWYIPVFITSMEVTSVEWGDPKPELFSIPSDYRQVEDPHEKRLLERIARQASLKSTR